MSTILAVLFFAATVVAITYVIFVKEDKTPKISFKAPAVKPEPVEEKTPEPAKAPKVKRKYGGKVKSKKTTKE